MLLAVDIGNTTVGIGVFKDKTLVRDWRIRSDREKTSDEYSIIVLNLLGQAGLAASEISDAIISSVVPPLTPIFQSLIQALFGTKAVVVGPGLKTGVPILYENPLEVGADRVVAAAAAIDKFGGPCIVVDFGTATTFDAVSAKGEYLGGAIAPGIQISAEALAARTAKLPRVEIVPPRRAIGRTTVASMQSGIYYGYVGLVNNIIAEIKKELDPRPGEKVKVVATGGFAGEIAAEIPDIDEVEPQLVLQGLRLLFERSRSS
jgi:type III pantothenate kinase